MDGHSIADPITSRADTAQGELNQLVPELRPRSENEQPD